MSDSPASATARGSAPPGRLAEGQPAPEFVCIDTSGATVRLQDLRGRRVLVAFHRFAACPFCNLRMHRVIEASSQLGDRLAVVAFFQSPREVIAAAVGRQQAPFPIVPDPRMEVYARYRVELSSGAVWKASVRRLPDAVRALRHGFVPRQVDGHVDLVPAEFLIDEGGIVRTAYYGKDIGDHLPLERVRAFAAGAVASHPESHHGHP